MTLVKDPSPPGADGNQKYLIYNPVDIDEKTQVAVDKVLGEKGVISDMVVPTRQTWQSIEPWIKKYTKATVWHAGNVPRETLHLYEDLTVRSLKSSKTPNFEPNASPIFPQCHLYKMHGDDMTNEHVMFHADSKTLSCTDLYHGGYTDLDPLNSWLCRFWFKCQKMGDHKNQVFMPKFRKSQIEKQGTVDLMQEAVDELTQVLPIDYLVFSHGSGPLQGNAVAQLLRAQYALR